MTKKIFSLLLALLMAAPAASVMSAATAPEQSVTAEAADRILGDINADESVDILDAIALFQHSMLPEMYLIDYPGTLDMDDSGALNIDDAIRLFRYSVMPEMYPIGWGDEGIEDTPFPVDLLTINGTDISEYVIACNAEAGGVIPTAAAELQKYIELTCGAALEIDSDGVEAGTKRILIDENIVEDTDDFKYYTDEDGLVLAGSAKRGALYAVYNFLEEQLGWRFFAADTEVCNEARSIRIKNLDYTYEHAFEIRDIYWTEAFDDMFSVKRYQNGEGKRRVLANDNPDSIALGGSESMHPNGTHTIAALSETGDHEQPCLSDETVYQNILKNVIAWLSEDTTRKSIHISQNNNENWCMCEACFEDIDKYGAPAATIIKMLNRLDEDLKAAGYEDITLVTFAYKYSFKCPTGIVCNEDVAVEVITNDFCFNHAFDDPDCAINAKRLKTLKSWAAICSNLYVWDYSVNFMYYLSPFPNFDVIRDNMRVFNELGAVAMLSQGNYQTVSPEFGALRTYLLAKLMQNPTMSEEEYNRHMNEFLEAYYGAGWENIRAYIDYFTELANTKDDCFGIYSTPEVMFGGHAFAPASEQLVEWFADALKLAENEAQTNHIRQTQICCEWLRIGAIHYEVTERNNRSEVERMRSATDKLFAACQEFGVRVAENAPLPDAIQRRWNPRDWWSGHNYQETGAPETEVPEVEAPETDAPETDAPATDAPATDAPATDAPATEVPETEDPNPAPINYLTINGIDISEYVIATNAAAGGVMTHAATELQKYIELTCGVLLEIDYDGVEAGTKRILIDETTVTDNEKVHIYNDADGIVLAGTAKRSCLYAVYNLLQEKLNWRFFAEDAEVCYEEDRIDLSNLDYTFKPSFEIRDIYDLGYYDPYLSTKRYINGDGQRHEMYPDNPESVKFGGSETRCPNGIHNIGYLSGRDASQTQPCTNNEYVRKAILKSLRDFLAENPDVKTLHVSQEDHERYCKCDKCLADLEAYGTPAGAYLEMMNWLCEQLEDEYPNVLLIMFAYRYTMDAPKNIEAHKNVMVEFAIIDFCHQHAMTEDLCNPDPDQTLIRSNADVLAQIEAWTQIVDQFYLWDYGANFRYYYMPYPTFDVLLANYKYLIEIGAWGFIYQCNTQAPNAEFGVLRDYLVCKIVDNPDMTEEEYNNHINEFLACYYGPGWENIRAYFDLLHEIANENGECFGVYSNPEKIYGDYAFGPYSDQMREWFNNAIAAAETEAQLLHLRRLRISCDFLRLGAIHADVYASNDYKAIRQQRNDVKQLYNDCKDLGIIYICEYKDYKLPDSIDYSANPRTWWENGRYPWLFNTYVEKVVN